MSEQDVSSQSAAVMRMAKHWPMIRALMDGTDAMRCCGETFLPKWPNEDADGYKARLKSAVLTPIFSRTVGVMAAKPMARPLKLSEKLDSRVVEYLADVDMQGTELHAFCSQLLVGCLSFGLHGVLVDYPVAGDLKTKADEDAVGVRPYFTQYPAESILGWRVENGALSQIRLLEHVTEPDGDFGEKEIRQVRVLTPGAWQVWRKVRTESGTEAWVIHSEGTTSIQFVPFVFFYGIRQGFGIGAPPLLDLAYQNVQHWQSNSDQQTIEHVARVPILFAKGFGNAAISIGAAQAVTSDNPDADLSYVEHTGAAITTGRESIRELEERMRQTGAELLMRPSKVTATQVVSEGEANKSTLQKIVEEFEQSLHLCIDMMCDWIALEAPEESVELYDDFGAVALDDQTLASLNNAATAGNLSRQTVFKEMQRRDIVSPELSWEEEQKRIQQERKALAPAAVTGQG